jgi:SpoVK/Ycf46/Vps4 family AAA+-type ATPase
LPLSYPTHNDPYTLSMSGADVFSMYVGEGEAIVRELFARARMAAPAIVFLDEVDALASRRASGSGEPPFNRIEFSGPCRNPLRAFCVAGGGGGDSAERILSTLLTEMDGLEDVGACVRPTWGVHPGLATHACAVLRVSPRCWVAPRNMAVWFEGVGVLYRRNSQPLALAR